MTMNLKQLTPKTRKTMLAELDYAVKNNALYISDRLTPQGKNLYPEILKHHIETGNPETMEAALQGLFNLKEQYRKSTGAISTRAMPKNAPQLLAEGEFNRFYMRALCLIALEENKQLKIYRARLSKKARPESEVLIGQPIDPKNLLNDLRTHIGSNTISGIGDINSGLSVEFVEKS